MAPKDNGFTEGESALIEKIAFGVVAKVLPLRLCTT